MEKVFEKYFNGELDNDQVSQELFNMTYDRLATGVNEGWAGTDNENDLKLMLELKTNVAVFSAFKSHAQGKEYVNLLTDQKGNVRSWSEFRKLAIDIDAEYNRNWLETEYVMARRQARAAEQWTNFVEQQDQYPNLEYMPSQAADPSDDHRKYYGIIKPITDPFWNTALPPSRWNCKCWVKQTKAEPTDQEIEAPLAVPGVEGNPGKSGRVFSATTPFLKDATKQNKEMIQNTLKKLRNPLTDYVELKEGKRTIKIHVNADSGDLAKNVNTAKILVNELKVPVEIRAHFKGSDEKKNPEYLIRNTIADQVFFEGKNIAGYISRHFKSKASSKKGQFKDFDQGIIVFNLDNQLKEEMIPLMLAQLNSKMLKYTKITSVVFINKGKAIEVKQGFDIVKTIKMMKGKLL